MVFFPLKNTDFDISTIGDEQSKHATQMFASMNFFQNPDAPHRSFKDDLESLVCVINFRSNFPNVSNRIMN